MCCQKYNCEIAHFLPNKKTFAQLFVSMSKSGSSEKKSDKNDVQDVFGKLQPYLEKLIDLYSKASPYIDIVMSYLNIAFKQIEPYYKRYWKPEYIQIFVGLVLLFFGGSFAMTIACYMVFFVTLIIL